LHCRPDSLSRQAYTPLTRLIDQVEDQRYQCQDYKDPGKQNQCRDHFLHEINL